MPTLNLHWKLIRVQGEPVSIDHPIIKKFTRKCPPASQFNPNPPRVFQTDIVTSNLDKDLLPLVMNSCTLSLPPPTNTPNILQKLVQNSVISPRIYPVSHSQCLSLRIDTGGIREQSTTALNTSSRSHLVPQISASSCGIMVRNSARTIRSRLNGLRQNLRHRFFSRTRSMRGRNLL
jgi:hypothetical protein